MAIDLEPIVGYTKAFSLLFIVTLLIISILFLNLFIGVVIETYNVQKDIQSKNYMLMNIQK